MTGFALMEFRALVDKCLGGAEAAAIDQTTLDTEFGALGLDSLTVFEISVRIQDEYDVHIQDEELDELKTPRQFIAHVAARMPASR